VARLLLAITRCARAEQALSRAAYPLHLIILAAIPALAQHERGEMRLKVLDAKGGPLVAASVDLVSQANQVRRSFLTDEDGNCLARQLPFGRYRLQVSRGGFLSAEQLVEVRSELPLNISVTLGLAPIQSSVNVTDAATLVDPDRSGSIYSIGSQAIREELPAQMGRGLTNLVDSEPGWLYEANGVLHPRGSEYDVQFVVNGLPLTENRSPAFAPPLESEEAESMRVMTAAFPAEYGRKLGGVVEVTAPQDLVSGLHMTNAVSGGSFSTGSGYVGVGYGRGAN